MAFAVFKALCVAVSPRTAWVHAVFADESSQEGEGHDRYTISLPGAQAELIDSVAASAKKPIVLVIM